MARSYYKDGLPLAVKNRKEKFARYNIKRDLNHIYYSYQLKDGLTFSGDDPDNPQQDLGSTFSNFLNRIRLNGDTEITLNLTKDRNLFPAGRLRGVRSSDADSPVFATDGEGAVFANADNISFQAKQDIINLGGKDQFRVLTEDELTTPEDIPGDQRNVGDQVTGLDTNLYGYAVPLPNGKTLTWDVINKKFITIEDTSTNVIPGPIFDEDIYLGFSIDTLHDIREYNPGDDVGKYVVLYDNSGNTYIRVISIDFNETVTNIFTYSNLITQDTRPKLTLGFNNDFYVLTDELIYKFVEDEDDSTNFIQDTVDSEGVETLGVTNNVVYGFKREEYKDPSISDVTYNNGEVKLLSSSTDYNYFIVSDLGVQVDNERKLFLVKENNKIFFAYINRDSSLDRVTGFEADYDGELAFREIKATHDYVNNRALIWNSKSTTTPWIIVDLNTGVSSTLPTLTFVVPQSLSYSKETNRYHMRAADLIELEDEYIYTLDIDGGIINKVLYTFSRNDAFNVLGNFVLTLSDGQSYINQDGTIEEPINEIGESGDILSGSIRVDDSGSEMFMVGFYEFKISEKKFVINKDFLEIVEVDGTDFTSFAMSYANGIYHIQSFVSIGVAVDTYRNYFIDKFNNLIYKKVTSGNDGINIKIFEENNDTGVVYLEKPILILNLFPSDTASGLTSSDVVYLYLLFKDNQYFKKWNVSTLEYIGETKIPQATFELFSNFSKRTSGGNILFAFAGSIISLNDSGILGYKEIYANEENLLLDIIDIEEDQENSIVIGYGNVWDIKKLETFLPLGGELFSLGADLNFVVPPYPPEEYFIDGNEEQFLITYDWASDKYRQLGLLKGGLWTRISKFDNDQIHLQGFVEDSEGRRGGIFKEKWSEPNPNDSSIPALGEEDRTEDIPGNNVVTGQQIYLSRNVRMTPTGDGSANHYSYDASRIDIPKFKNADGKYIKFNFLLEAAIKGVNVRYVDIDSSALVGYNQIQFVDDNDDIVPFEIADTDFELGTHLTDEEMWDPKLFNDGLGNEAWNIHKAYPIVNGSEVKWEFTDITTMRYYDLLFESLQNSTGWFDSVSNAIGSIADFVPEIVGLSMIQDVPYFKMTTTNIVGSFSDEFMKAMYAGTIGAMPNGESSKNFETATNNFGLDVSDNSFARIKEFSTNPPDRRFNFTQALMIQDSFLIEGLSVAGVGLPDSFYISKMKYNPKLFNDDLSHTDTYKQYKNNLITGTLNWNGATFRQKFSDENSGNLTTVVKDSDVNNWSIGSGEDPKYAMLLPNTIDEVKDAIKESGDGENPQVFKEINAVQGLFTGVFPNNIKVPEAIGMYSRLNQEPFTNEAIASNLGLRTNSKIRLIFPENSSPKRFRISGFGGNTWTFTEWDENFDLAVDASGDQVIPRAVQSPNLSLEPNSAFKDIVLGL